MITSSGFYDRSIIGGGDRIMLNGFTGHYVGMARKMPTAMAEDIKAFGHRLTPRVGPSNVSYTPGVVLHIWHGNRADRDYTHRALAASRSPVSRCSSAERPAFASVRPQGIRYCSLTSTIRCTT